MHRFRRRVFSPDRCCLLRERRRRRRDRARKRGRGSEDACLCFDDGFGRRRFSRWTKEGSEGGLHTFALWVGQLLLLLLSKVGRKNEERAYVLLF